jgi:bla regulator protein BlaR1
MMLAWMVCAVLFGAWVALATSAAERIARAAGVPARGLWCGALAIAAVWPLCSPLVASIFPQLHAAVATLPAVRVVPDGAAFLARAPSVVIDAAGPALLTLWGIASLLLAVRLVRSLRDIRRLRDAAEPLVVDGVPVLVTEEVGPATVGLRRPAVLMPRAVLDLEEPLRRLVLHHEREHCTAHDPRLLTVAAGMVVLLPWNPALWLIARRLHLALEIDCDARVLASGADSLSYGRLLLLIAQRRGAIPLAPTLAAPASHLERRIIAMQTRLAVPRKVHLAGAAAALVLGLAGACSSAAPDAPPARPTTARLSRPSRPVVLDANAPMYEFQVEQQARPVTGTGSPHYPDAMRRAKRQGEVLAQVVVDEHGAVDMSTFKANTSSDPAFTDAVRTALPTMRFHPAMVGGKPVKQVVQQPFTFALPRKQ